MREVKKIKQWLETKNEAQFEIISCYNDGKIISVRRLKDGKEFHLYEIFCNDKEEPIGRFYAQIIYLDLNLRTVNVQCVDRGKKDAVSGFQCNINDLEKTAEIMINGCVSIYGDL